MNATPPVRYLVLWLTTACNLRCTYCYRGDQPGQTMSVEVARTALNLAAASGLPFHVQLAGGEPTLEPELMEAIGKIIREAGWSATLAVQTNGTLIDKHLVDMCQRSSIAFGISLDGPPELHERIRGNSAATFRGLALLDRARIPVHVTAVLSALNVMHLDRLIMALACFANVQGVALDPVVLKGNALLSDEHRSAAGSQATAFNSVIPSESDVQAGIHTMLFTLNRINRMRFPSHSLEGIRCRNQSPEPRSKARELLSCVQRGKPGCAPGRHRVPVRPDRRRPHHVEWNRGPCGLGATAWHVPGNPAAWRLSGVSSTELLPR